MTDTTIQPTEPLVADEPTTAPTDATVIVDETTVEPVAPPDEPTPLDQSDDVEAEPDSPKPLLVRLDHGGEVIFHNTKAELKKRYPGATILRFADGTPFRGEKQV